MALERRTSCRDMAGRKREYETIYILKPDVSADMLGAVNTKMRQVIEGQGGQLLKIDNWGKRKLAYEVAKNSRGVYLFLHYLGTAGVVEELERNLRLQEAVIRTYSVKIAENIDPATRTSEVTDENFAAAGTPGPDRDDVVTAPSERPFGDDEEGAFDFEEAVFGELDGNKGGSR
jgi:small subunit ribosomal protein S6